MADAARQQMKSCDNCRKRKVKCDSKSRSQCSACAKAKLTCKFDLGWRRRSKRVLTPEVTEVPPGNSNNESPDRVRQDRSSTGTHGGRGDESSDGLPTELTASLHWAQNSLYRFFKEGVSTSRSNWTAFNPVDQVRTAYVGSHLSNLTHLIELASNSPPSFIIYAYPDIHDHTRRKASPISGSTSSNDRLKSVESFPSAEIRDNLVEAFFTKIHPFFPIVDESDFRQRCAAVKSKVPVLLLHAVLLVGARVTEHPRVVRSRETVMAVLFSRAKKAFDMRDENDRMHLVQAALLFSWHLQDGDNVAGNSWYWIGVACRIALGLGMHRNVLRDPVDANRMPLCDRRAWRRIWWALFQMEIMSALEHGRPSMIRAGDYDQEPLCKEDLIEANGELNTKVDFDCSSRGVALCEIALTISCLSAPGFQQIGQHRIEEDIKSLKQRLVAWMLAEETSEASTTFGPLHLRLRYDTIVLHLNRMVDDPNFDRQAESRSDVVEASKLSSASALSIIVTLEKIHSNDMLSQCDFTVVTALSAAAIQISKDLRHAIEVSNLMLAISERQLLGRACAVAEQLSRLWPNAEGVRKVFRSILDSMVDGLETKETNTISMGAARQESADDANGLEPNTCDVDWTDIMAFESLAAEDIDWNGSLFGFEQHTT